MYYARHIALNLYRKLNGLGPANSMLVLVFPYLQKKKKKIQI